MWMATGFSAFVYCLGGYWINGWTKDFTHFLGFSTYPINIVCIVLLLTASGNAIGFFCSALFKIPGRVTAMTNIVVMPMVVISGIFNKLTFMPVWISWLQYMSVFRYGLHLFLIN